MSNEDPAPNSLEQAFRALEGETDIPSPDRDWITEYSRFFAVCAPAVPARSQAPFARFTLEDPNVRLVVTGSAFGTGRGV
jgi:hypothetical protein